MSGDRVRYAPNRVLFNTTQGLKGEMLSSTPFPTDLSSIREWLSDAKTLCQISMAMERT